MAILSDNGDRASALADRDRISRLEAEVHDIVPAVHQHSADLAYIKRSVGQLLERERRPYNWIGFGSFAVAAMTVMAGFVLMVNNASNKSIESNSASIGTITSELTQRSYMFGYNAATLEKHTAELAAIDALDQSTAQELISIREQLGYIKGMIGTSK